jgi:hypothetical protein
MAALGVIMLIIRAQLTKLMKLRNLEQLTGSGRATEEQHMEIFGVVRETLP